MVLKAGRGYNCMVKINILTVLMALRFLQFITIHYHFVALRFLQFITIQAKPNCLIFLDNDTVVVGGESKEAQV